MTSFAGAFSRARARQVIVALAALASLLLTLRLGAWQLDRAAQKTALQSAIALRSSLPVVEGPSALEIGRAHV